MAVGALLGGKYRLEALLGKGGMGSVWRARNLKLDAPVAVKLMDPAIATDPAALMRFHREAHAGATLRSPHVLQVFDHDVDAATGYPFIVMELLEGEPLSRRLERVGLSLAQTEAVVRDVCRGLAVAHQHGIVHRDLKPDNIFLERNQDEELAKILDFGIAKSLAFAVGPGTQTGTVMGTPFYMSPEQLRSTKHADARSDLWSVAVIVYECVTGRRPFQADTFGALAVAICTDPIVPVSDWVRVPSSVDAWFARALDRDPARRFQSAAELAQAFTWACEAAAGQRVVPANRVPANPVATNPIPANRVTASAPSAYSRHEPLRPALGGAAVGNHTLAEPPPPPAPAPVVVKAGSHTRQILLSYGLAGALMVGMVGYTHWLQTGAMERAEAIAHPTPVVTVSSEPRAWVRQLVRPWVPGVLVALVTVGAGLGKVLLGRKRPERGA